MFASTNYQSLSSFGYPSNYENNMYCKWFVSAPADQVIEFYVHYMDIESGHDFLYLFQGWI